MSAISLNGKAVVSGSITTPTYGAWAGDVVLGSGVDVGDPAVLSIGNLTLRGTVVRKGVFAGSQSARLVAGAGGWRGELPARGYSHIAGVRLKTVLGDAASEAGETIDIPTDRTLGTHWARERAKAERVLNLLLQGRWWIDPDGITRVVERDPSPISTPFTVLSWSGGKGQFEIATEFLSSWQPGRTFTAPTVPAVQTISSVTIESDNDGQLRLHVLSTDGATERLRDGLRSLVRAESPALSYASVYEYNVAASVGLGLSAKIDCTPTSDLMPALTGVPLFGIGIIVPPVAGTKCRIRFVNGDPARPECISLEGSTEHLLTAEAGALMIYNTLATLALANAGVWIGATNAPLLAAAVSAALAAAAIPAPPGLVAQVTAAAAQAGNFVSGTPASTAAPFAAAIATALDAKSLDVSGLFPSVGVPNG